MWRWLKDIYHFLLPVHCIQCNCPITEQAELFCLSCYSQLPQTSHFKLKENDCYNRFVKDGYLVNYVAAMFYFEQKSSLKVAIHLLKYGRKSDIGYNFGLQLGRKINNTEELQDVDFIIPMPLHTKRKKQRGYNQSDFIAKGVKEMTGVPIEFDSVKRVKYTLTQTKMNKLERKDNMTNAFKWIKTFPEHTHFMIIDDVVTTGASIQSLILAYPSWKTCKFSVICIGYTR